MPNSLATEANETLYCLMTSFSKSSRILNFAISELNVSDFNFVGRVRFVIFVN